MEPGGNQTEEGIRELTYENTHTHTYIFQTANMDTKGWSRRLEQADKQTARDTKRLQQPFLYLLAY